MVNIKLSALENDLKDKNEALIFVGRLVKKVGS
jgi:hypothetical protein